LTLFRPKLKLERHGNLLVARWPASASAIPRRRHSFVGERDAGLRLRNFHRPGGPYFAGRKRKNHPRRNPLSVCDSRQPNSRTTINQASPSRPVQTEILKYRPAVTGENSKVTTVLPLAIWQHLFICRNSRSHPMEVLRRNCDGRASIFGFYLWRLE